MSIKKFIRATLLLAPALLLSACADDTKKDPYASYPPNYIYAAGHDALQHSHWNLALEAYQSLDSQYPFNYYTQKGDLDTIYANYENGDPAIALTEASRYIKIYPTDVDGVAYSYYMMGVINFDNGRGFLQRYLPYHMEYHNAANYTTAFNDFNIVVTNYPKSPYAADARRRMIYLNNVLAQFQMDVANFSYTQGAYVSAANRAINVILNYPTSPVTEDALEMMIKCYDKLGLTTLAASTERVLELNYPDDDQ